jgi:hypothetical protein
MTDNISARMSGLAVDRPQPEIAALVGRKGHCVSILRQRSPGPAVENYRIRNGARSRASGCFRCFLQQIISHRQSFTRRNPRFGDSENSQALAVLPLFS